MKPVPLTAIVREMLASEDRWVTFNELNAALLGVGMILVPGELSSVLHKLERGTLEVERMQVPRRARTGRQTVFAWRYKR